MSTLENLTEFTTRFGLSIDMNDSRRAVQVIEVQHVSAVAAIPSAEGPRAILEAGLLDALASGGARVDVLQLPSPVEPAGEVGKAFAMARHVAYAVREALQRGRLPVVLSGSCHTALGSVAGLPTGRRAVIWLDCHADFNTPDTTQSGLLDGTVLATITGRCWKRLALSVPGFEPVSDPDVLLVGVRELDAGEARLLDGARVGRLSSEDVRAGNLAAVRSRAMHVDSAYVHVDLDVLDPSVGTANAYARPGGLSVSDLVGFLETVSESFGVRVVGLASYDPQWDEDGSIGRAAIRGATAFAG